MTVEDTQQKIKYCPKCNKTRSMSDFHKDKSNKDGHAFYCKECSAEYGRIYRDTPAGIYSGTTVWTISSATISPSFGRGRSTAYGKRKGESFRTNGVSCGTAGSTGTLEPR